MIFLKHHAEPQPPNSASLTSSGYFIENLSGFCLSMPFILPNDLNFCSNTEMALNLGTFGDLWLQRE